MASKKEIQNEIKREIKLLKLNRDSNLAYKAREIEKSEQKKNLRWPGNKRELRNIRVVDHFIRFDNNRILALESYLASDPVKPYIFIDIIADIIKRHFPDAIDVSYLYGNTVKSPPPICLQIDKKDNNKVVIISCENEESRYEITCNYFSDEISDSITRGDSFYNSYHLSGKLSISAIYLGKDKHIFSHTGGFDDIVNKTLLTEIEIIQMIKYYFNKPFGGKYSMSLT